MSTRTHDINAQAWAYILDAITDVDDTANLTTDKQKVDYAWACYCAEGRFPAHLHYHKGNEAAAFADFIAGAPSWFNIDHENHAILQLAKDWGSLPKRPKPAEEYRILTGWYNFITVKFFQLRGKLTEKDYLNPHLLTLNNAATV